MSTLDSHFGPLDKRKSEVKSARARCEEASVTADDITAALLLAGVDVLDYNNLDVIVDAAIDQAHQRATATPATATATLAPGAGESDDASVSVGAADPLYEPGVYQIYIHPPVTEMPLSKLEIPGVYTYFDDRGDPMTKPLEVQRFINVQPLQCPRCRFQWEGQPPLRPGNMRLHDPAEQSWQTIFARGQHCPECLTKRKQAVRGGLYEVGEGHTKHVAWRQMRPRMFLTVAELERLHTALNNREWDARYAEQQLPGGKTRRRRVGYNKRPLKVEWTVRPSQERTIDLNADTGEPIFHSGPKRSAFVSELVRIIGPLALDSSPALLSGEQLSEQQVRIARIDKLQHQINELAAKLAESNDPAEMKRLAKQITLHRQKAEQLAPAALT